MEVSAPVHLRVSESSGVGDARRRATVLAEKLGFPEADVGRVALVVTEAGTNLVKHAGGGELLLCAIPGAPSPGLAIVALDKGSGIADVARALRDGVSTARTPGNGLGAINRLSTAFDLYSTGGGSALVAKIFPVPPAARPRTALHVGAIGVPYPGEPISGDAWALHEEGSVISLIVADGLGHGALAAEPAKQAAAVFARHARAALTEILERIHAALRSTRGAAVALARVDPDRGILQFAGIGNVAGTIVANGGTRSVVSHHGTAGHQARRIQEFTYPWSSDATFVMHSDGLASHWSLDRYPGLAGRDPLLQAAVLYRDHARGRDDTTVVVVKAAT